MPKKALELSPHLTKIANMITDRIYQYVFSLALVLFLRPSVSTAGLDANQILKAADEIRNPSESFKMQVQLKDAEHEYEYDVLVKGKEKSIIVSKKPAREAGRNMLMLNRDFYLYMPNLKRSMRLSLSQKLSGQVSYGDVARTRWYGDYDIESSSVNKDGVVELNLLANKTGLTYERIKLEVDQKTERPLKAQYLSRDGKVILKTAYFENYKAMAGKQRPTLIRIQDVGSKESYLNILSMKSEELSDSLFSEGRLSSLK